MKIVLQKPEDPKQQATCLGCIFDINDGYASRCTEPDGIDCEGAGIWIIELEEGDKGYEDNSKKDRESV